MFAQAISSTSATTTMMVTQRLLVAARSCDLPVRRPADERERPSFR